MKNKNIGIDHCKFDLVFKTKQTNEAYSIPLINDNHFTFGEIASERGKMKISMCLPRYFEVHNAIPFKMNQLKYFDEISDCVKNTIRENFNGPYKTELTSIEMNITEVFDDCDYEKILLLLNHSMLDGVKQNARYEIKSDKSIVKPMTSGVKTRLIKGRYLVKAYDKKKQVEAEYQFTLKEHPLRIEFVFSKLALEKLFGSRRKIDDIFCKAGLSILINAYIDTLNEVIKDFVYPYLQNIHEQMMIHIRKSGNIAETYCEFKEVIYDQEQIRQVLKQWYQEKGENDNSRSMLSRLNKKYHLPKGTLKIIKELLSVTKR